MYLSSALPKTVAVSMLLLSISACSAPSSKVTPAVPNAEFSAADFDKPVAIVNGRAISAAELKRAKKILMTNKPGLQIPPLLQKEFEMQALNQLISSELLYQASQKVEIKGLDQQAQEKLAQIKKGFPDPTGYDRELQKIGMDEKMLLEATRRDLAIAYFVNTNIASKPVVSEEEIKKFYDQSPEKFRQEEQVRASHILIAVAGKAGVEERKAAREKADKLHQELAGGADFAKLAQENSGCPSSKQGGDLGYFAKGKMVPSFEQAAFALQQGAVSEVVETGFGYHIIKLTDRKKAEEISLATARDSIENYLKMQKTNEAVESFVAAARKEAKIELLLPQTQTQTQP
ncbi:MAG: peptidylprolyl isomerase [Geobacteraceae bacterium GWC2_58_44]|nr:MAG: peptidylprolyl isomerase [Geobacteraceae bacterium GWC2_58_44]HBG07580.1 peptidylprolyl isomerase [Geobacter sp.]